MLEEIKNYIKGLYNDFEYIREILNESELKTFDAIWLKRKEQIIQIQLKI